MKVFTVHKVIPQSNNPPLREAIIVDENDTVANLAEKLRGENGAIQISCWIEIHRGIDPKAKETKA